MRFLFIIILLFLLYPLHGQIQFTNLNSVWDNRLDEWIITGYDVEEEVVEFQLSLTWPLRNNWDEWRISGDSYTATIRQKWRGNDSHWELRNSSEIVQIRQTFRGDPSQWDILSGGKRVSLSTLYRNNANDWVIARNQQDWHMYSEYIDDPRDWLIEDYSFDELTDSMRMAMIFISLWQSIPKS